MPDNDELAGRYLDKVFPDTVSYNPSPASLERQGIEPTTYERLVEIIDSFRAEHDRKPTIDEILAIEKEKAITQRRAGF